MLACSRSTKSTQHLNSTLLLEKGLIYLLQVLHEFGFAIIQLLQLGRFLL